MGRYLDALRDDERRLALDTYCAWQGRIQGSATPD